MKRSDLVILLVVLLALLPFFLFKPVLDFYQVVNKEHAYLASFMKFAVLATFGESIGLRIRTGSYWRKGFGFLPRAIVLGFLGISIKMAFVIFGEGTPYMLKTLGVAFPAGNPGDVLRQHEYTGLKLLSAFSVSTTLNLFFAPVFMTFHKITDMHILENEGTLKGFFTPIQFRRLFASLDWSTMWGFVFKKTIPLFWIPAQTVNFMLPEEYRVLFAAFLSIVLGILLSVAGLHANSKKSIKMFRHIIMFKLKEFHDASEKQNAAEKVREALLEMKKKIPVIREFEVGINVGADPSAYDVVINSAFDRPEDLEKYRLHPEHQAFIAFNRDYTERKAVVDFFSP